MLPFVSRNTLLTNKYVKVNRDADEIMREIYIIMKPEEQAIGARFVFDEGKKRP